MWCPDFNAKAFGFDKTKEERKQEIKTNDCCANLLYFSKVSRSLTKFHVILHSVFIIEPRNFDVIVCSYRSARHEMVRIEKAGLKKVDWEYGA